MFVNNIYISGKCGLPLNGARETISKFFLGLGKKLMMSIATNQFKINILSKLFIK